VIAILLFLGAGIYDLVNCRDDQFGAIGFHAMATPATILLPFEESPRSSSCFSVHALSGLLLGMRDRRLWVALSSSARRGS
jgi:hypothetical protein